MNKYLAKIIASDQEGLQMISACSSGAKVKIADIKYLASNKVFLLSIERTRVESNQEDKTINSICRESFSIRIEYLVIIFSFQWSLIFLLQIILKAFLLNKINELIKEK